METSILIARLVAVVYLAVAAGMLLSPGFYRRLFKEIGDSPITVYFGGIIALVVGFLIITYHNRWEMSWQVMVTILGWMGVIKGVALLVLPERMARFTAGMGPGMMRLSWIFALVLGVYFLWFGFINPS